MWGVYHTAGSRQQYEIPGSWMSTILCIIYILQWDELLKRYCHSMVEWWCMAAIILETNRKIVVQPATIISIFLGEVQQLPPRKIIIVAAPGRRWLYIGTCCWLRHSLSISIQLLLWMAKIANEIPCIAMFLYRIMCLYQQMKCEYVGVAYTGLTSRQFSRCLFAWRTILPNFTPIRLETTER